MSESASAPTYFTDKQIVADPEFRGVVTASTLQKLRVRGGGPQYAKVGSKCLYRRDWMRAWLESHAITSTSDNKG